jgi:hypothetical protein
LVVFCVSAMKWAEVLVVAIATSASASRAASSRGPSKAAMPPSSTQAKRS